MKIDQDIPTSVPMLTFVYQSQGIAAERRVDDLSLNVASVVIIMPRKYSHFRPSVYKYPPLRPRWLSANLGQERYEITLRQAWT